MCLDLLNNNINDNYFHLDFIMKSISPMLSKCFKLSFLSLSILNIQYSYAADTVDNQVQTLSTIQLQAQPESADQSSEKTKAYTVKNSSSASKLNIAVKETPQTVNVVTRQQIEDFGLNDAREILSVAPGIVVSSQETNRTTYTARGFDISNFQIDGSNMPLTGSDYQNGDIDALLYDRIEVVKGSNGLTSSTGNPSATVNYIRKRPTHEFQSQANISYGSWDTVRGEVDLSGSLNNDESIRTRVMAAQESGNSYLDHYSQEKTVAGIILEADVTKNTLVTLGYNFQKDRPNGNNWGALPMLNSNGELLSYDRSYNPMPDWTHWDMQKQNAFIELKHKFNEDWSINTSYNYNEQKENGAMLYFTGVPDSNTGTGVNEYPSIYTEINKNHNIDISILGKYNLFGNHHDLMFGTNWAKSDVNQQSLYINGRTAGISDWFNYDNNQYPDFIYDYESLGNKANYTQEQKQVYAATRLNLNEKLKVLAGVNYTDAKAKGQTYGNSSYFDEDRLLPYAGITYNFNPTYTAYASYSTIFKPTNNLGLDKQTLAPTEGTSSEIGIKGSWFDDQLIISSAIFRNDYDKFPIYAKWDQAYLYSQQDIKSQGYEFNIAGKITDNLNISAGYVQQNMKDKDTNKDVRTFVPEQTFNILTSYTLPQLPQLKVGASMTWQSSTSQSATSNLIQDSYALINLMANYDVNDHFSIQANAKNITNEKYFNSLEYGQTYYGAPANYNVALKFKY